jgi:hypothetical protein
MNTTQIIKSVMPVLKDNEWVARIRYADRSESFTGIGYGYNLAQCQTFIKNNYSCGLELTHNGHITRWHNKE